MIRQCAVSGAEAEGTFSEEDGLELPPGWVEVQVIRRRPNPAWALAQQMLGQTTQEVLRGLQAQLLQSDEAAPALVTVAETLALSSDQAAALATIPEFLEAQVTVVAVDATNPEAREVLVDVLDALAIEPDAWAPEPTEELTAQGTAEEAAEPGEAESTEIQKGEGAQAD
jgi:hypothetical protein